MGALLGLVLSPAGDALHNYVALVVVGLAILLVAERELLRAWRGNAGAEPAAGPGRSPAAGPALAALVVAVVVIVLVRLAQLG